MILESLGLYNGTHKGFQPADSGTISDGDGPEIDSGAFDVSPGVDGFHYALDSADQLSQTAPTMLGLVPADFGQWLEESLCYNLDPSGVEIPAGGTFVMVDRG